MANILIVDDELNQQKTLAIGLRLEGFCVRAVSNAREALALAEAEPFDVALVDLMLPGISGLELARALRCLCPTLRVVLTSAYPLSVGQLARCDCGAAAFLPKPYALPELAAFLRRATAERGALSFEPLATARLAAHPS